LYLLQKAEEVAITAEEDMEPHFDMVPLLVDKRTNLAADKRPGVVQINLQTAQCPNFETVRKARGT
jgi:hypothetical protein